MEDRMKYNGLILGLVANCLVRQSVRDCPLYALEILETTEQIERIEALSDHEIREIICHHQECISRNKKIAANDF